MPCVADIPHTAPERQALATLWEREALLSGSCHLLLDLSVTRWKARTACAPPPPCSLESVDGMVLVSSREPIRPRRVLPRLDVLKPSPSKKPCGTAPSGRPARSSTARSTPLTSSTSAHGIQAASTQARQHLATAPQGEVTPLLWEACRTHARPRLDDLAQRLEPSATWDELVCCRNRAQICATLWRTSASAPRRYETWGFATQSARGLGMSALFAGPSRHGARPYAVEVALAHALQLDLTTLDTQRCGQQVHRRDERNLRRVFAAEEGGAILLDEADALFGKRSGGQR